MLYYIKNCFLLLIPVLLWNLILTRKLPERYQSNCWDNVPSVLLGLESILRFIVFSFPLLLRLDIDFQENIAGLLLYITGNVFYFTSWIVQITFPESRWSKSLIGYAAPAYTPILWLLAIGLLGQKWIFTFSYHYSIYISISLLFVAVHTKHAILAYRNQRD